MEDDDEHEDGPVPEDGVADGPDPGNQRPLHCVRERRELQDLVYFYSLGSVPLILETNILHRNKIIFHLKLFYVYIRQDQTDFILKSLNIKTPNLQQQQKLYKPLDGPLFTFAITMISGKPFFSNLN